MRTIICLLMLSMVVHGAPPPPVNDDFANATTIVASGSVSVAGVNAKATTQANEPTIAGEIVLKSVWWSWTAPFSGPATINTIGSSFDTQLGVFTGEALGALTSIAENDDANGLYTSSVTFNATGGVPYVILVGGYSGAGGKVKLNITLTGSGPCVYSITPASRSVTYTTVNSSVAVTTTTGCAWSAVSNDAWISITAGSSGSGSGTVTYFVAANTAFTSRTGTLTVAGLTHTIFQAAAPACTYSITPASASFTAAPATNSFTMTAGTGCTWTATPNAPWITIQSGASGSGNGTTTYVILTNGLSNSRTGTITLAGLTHVVTQDGTVPCTYSISPTSASFATSGGTSNIVINTLTACAWTASSGAPWVTFSTTNGTGNATVTYTVATNTTTVARSGALTVAGNTFTVNQAAAACTYALSPTSASIAATGGTGTIVMIAGTGCAWTAVANVSWITITSGTSGSGNGSIGYSVAANPNPSTRPGTLTIGGQTFTVNQAAAVCSYVITPTAAHYNDVGGNGNITITAGTGCTWAAVSNDTWLVLNSGLSGSGNGTVNYTAMTNATTVSRTGTITAATKTFTVTQDGTVLCTYGITPSSASATYTGVTNTISVAANSGCAWSASSAATWITLSPANGTGNGTVTYVVAANSSSVARSGTLTIAGNTFTLNQTGAPCTYSTSPASASYSYTGGTGTIVVTATIGCGWTSSSDSSWLTATSGASGNGNGTLTYSVASTTSPTNRTGRLTVAGRVTIISQTGAPCTASISPTSTTVLAQGVSDVITLTESDPACTWTATDSATWISVLPTSGTGSASLNYSVSPTVQTTSRSGTITIAGQVFNITQEGDTNAPTVSLTAPANGSTISNVISLTATASDDVSVSRVDFYRDSATLLGTDSTSPYSISYNTTNAANGAHTFYARAFDPANNQGLSTTNSVTVSNAAPVTTNQWVYGFGSTGPDIARAVAADGSGNPIFAGGFQGTANFGGGSVTSAGSFDLFIVKYTAAGAFVWSQNFGSTGAETVRSIAIDSGGNIFLAGSFAGTCNLGAGLVTSSGAQDIFIAKYSSLGACLWVKQIGSTGANDIAASIAVDSSGNIVVTGVFQGLVNFGGGAIQSKFGGTDTFLAKYLGTDGTYQWAKAFTQSGGPDEGTGVAVDGGDNILLTGYVNGSIDFGGGSVSSPSGMSLVYLAKFNSAGTFQWHRVPTVPTVSGTQGASRPYAVEVDSSSDVFVVGAYSVGIDFGGGTLTSYQWDVFLAKYSATGAYQWAKSFRGLGNEAPASELAVDSSGNVIIAGQFPYDINFGSTTLTSVTQNQNDGFVAKHSSAGVLTWAKSFGGPSGDAAQSVAVNSAGSIYVVGSFNGTASFNGQSLTSNGGSDIFVMKLTP